MRIEYFHSFIRFVLIAQFIGTGCDFYSGLICYGTDFSVAKSKYTLQAVFRPNFIRDFLLYGIFS